MFFKEIRNIRSVSDTNLYIRMQNEDVTRSMSGSKKILPRTSRYYLGRVHKSARYKIFSKHGSD